MKNLKKSLPMVSLVLLLSAPVSAHASTTSTFDSIWNWFIDVTGMSTSSTNDDGGRSGGTTGDP